MNPLLSATERHRYARHLELPELGEEGQRRLRDRAALVIGAGGLGCAALAHLVAAGIGRVGIIDGDRVDASNLHRQTLYGDADVGRLKTEAARDRLAAMNAHTQIEPYPHPLTDENADRIVARYDVVVDCTDNFTARILASDAAVRTRRADVYGAVLGFEGQVSVFGVGDGPCYRCLIPQPPPEAATPRCADAGVLGTLPGIVGAMQATEAIKILAGAGEPLIGRLLLIDGLRMRFETVRFARRAGCPGCAAARGAAVVAPATRAELPPETSVAGLAERVAAGAVLVVDVREPAETRADAVPGARNIPLSQIAEAATAIPRDMPIVLQCETGARSITAWRILRGAGFEDVSVLAVAARSDAPRADATTSP